MIMMWCVGGVFLLVNACDPVIYRNLLSGQATVGPSLPPKKGFIFIFVELGKKNSCKFFF